MAASRLFCSFLFWLKALFALFLSFGVFAFFSWRIYDLHQAAIAPKIDFGSGSSESSNGTVSPKCVVKPSTLARLEPNGKILFGFHLDWKLTTPLNVTQQIAPYKPGIYNAFVQIDSRNATGTEYNVALVQWHAEEVQRVGGILELTIEPVSDLSTFTDDLFLRLANHCRSINEKNGVPILLRWGHEMNGDWTSYGLKPVQFKQTYRKLASIVRSRTNVTALLWSPNVGVAYPFGNATGAPARGSPDFIELDTNADGILNGLDDPYLPYYPGDEYVDWAGISLYWYPDLVVGGTNSAPPPTFFHDYLTGSGPAVDAVKDTQYNAQLRNFYQRFGVERNKPIALSESGSPYAPSLQPGIGEVAIKKSWYTQILTQTTLSQFPKLKAFLNFEEKKADEVGGIVKDWSLTFNRDVLTQFKADLPSLAPLTIQSTQMKFQCDGSVEFKTSNSLLKRKEGEF
ncbi:hypothetical protein HK098_007258 [Nowakowskiella sp. JEL0407]|nr:hypothetical protein HK098_007258 [Nowakowskiella sp. JEL0407]